MPMSCAICKTNFTMHVQPALGKLSIELVFPPYDINVYNADDDAIDGYASDRRSNVTAI